MNRRLLVSLYGELVGTLCQLDGGRLSFEYHPEANRAISLSMPLRTNSYDDRVCEAFFGGLLPESMQARQAIGKVVHTSASNTFGLLRALGRDCAGALSITSEEDDRPKETSGSSYRVLSESELAQYIRELPKRPLFYGIDGIRLSLAGAQDKASVSIIDGQIALPRAGQPTSHILKPAIHHVPDSVINEALCLQLAKAIGIDTPRVLVQEAEGIPYLLVERYDRKVDEAGALTRIHQEDFCQALGVRSIHKYEVDGGPTFAQCFNLMLQTSTAAVNRQRLLERALFTILIGNHDAHGKNYALLHPLEGSIQLAPLYDVLCTAIYPELSSKMAMKVGGKYALNDVYDRHIQRFAKECGLSMPFIKKTVKSLGEQMLATLPSLPFFQSHALGPEIKVVIETRYALLVNRIGLV